MVRQLGVIQPEQVQDRGVPVGHADAVLDGGVAELVGGAVDVPRLDAAAGQPDAEAVLVVVAAVRRSADDRQPAELAAPDDQRLVEQAALFRSCSRPAIGWSVRSQAVAGSASRSAVVVPDLVVDVELHEPHAALDQPAGDQAAPAVGAGRLVVRCRTARGSPRVSGTRSRASVAASLHAGGQLVAGDAGVELRLAGAARGWCCSVEPASRSQLAALHDRRRRAGCGLQVQHRRAGRSGSACPGTPAAGSRPASSRMPLTGRPSGSSSTT